MVGHAKTCLVLVGGYVLFPAKNMDVQQVGILRRPANPSPNPDPYP